MRVYLKIATGRQCGSFVKSRFLQHPQKWSLGNQLIHRHLSKAKLMGSGSRSRESDKQKVRQLWWIVFGA